MNLVKGSNRERIAPEDVAALRLAGTLVQDARRERPRWFDGRFLAARDLIREQQYFLTREADLGQAAGSGVAVGLEVREGAAPQSLIVGPGHGVTPSGELVLLPSEVIVRLADIPRAEQLTARFGLGRLPQPPLRSRNGLFVLALRPVEFTANPVGAYPSSITGQRTVEDGDIIEATAIVLVPWPDDGNAQSADERRATAARTIFFDGVDRGVSANLLPLAMIALANNTVQWIDTPMVRRELGANRSDLPGLGFAPRALRLAYLLQHQAHVADVAQAANGRSFPAASHFSALPSAGPLPPAVINPADFTQGYFPAEIDVDFSIIPEDELPALIEESLALPGIDLSAAAETLESTSVLILAPVPRNEWRAVVARLTSLRRAIHPAAPNLIAARKPLEILQRIRLPRQVVILPDPTSPSDAEWQRLAQLPGLWFVRRRNIAYREDLAGAALRFAGAEGRVNDTLRLRLDGLGLRNNLDTVLERATPAASLELRNLLASPRFADSPALTAAAIGEFSRLPTLDQASALRTAATLTASQVGSGLARIETGSPGVAEPAALQAIVNRADWQSLDRAAVVARPESLAQLRSTLTGTAAITSFTVAPTTLTTPLRDTSTVGIRPAVTDTRINAEPALRTAAPRARGAKLAPETKGKGKGK
ncbi:MAG: hypothetical protein IPQ01_09470 [Zoogloea sp.]|nr:hypothetical protein [Zoogloea sp.]